MTSIPENGYTTLWRNRIFSQAFNWRTTSFKPVTSILIRQSRIVVYWLTKQLYNQFGSIFGWYNETSRFGTDLEYKSRLWYVPISSSVLRPIGTAYVSILVSDVKQEQLPSRRGDPEAIVVGAGLCEAAGERANTVFDPTLLSIKYKSTIAVDLCLSIRGFSINVDHTCRSEFCPSLSMKKFSIFSFDQFTHFRSSLLPTFKIMRHSMEEKTFDYPILDDSEISSRAQQYRTAWHISLRNRNVP